MLQLPRALVRQMRAILRKSVLVAASRYIVPPVVIASDGKELHLHAGNQDVIVQYRAPSDCAAATLVLAATALADFEGRGDDVVAFEPNDARQVSASWRDGHVPQTRCYEVPEGQEKHPLPALPAKMAAAPAGYTQAILHDASQTVARDCVRYALTQLLLRGQRGQVVATDGRQLLVQAGLALPWDEDVLVPALPVFGCRELAQLDPVHIGKTEEHVVIQIGPWTILLRIDKEGRYPPVDQLIPDSDKAVARLRLAPDDVEFLVHTLPRLPGQEEDEAPVTLDCGAEVVVRARAEGQKQATEATLTRSESSGKRCRCAVNRTHLLRALKLGFTEFCLYGPEQPVFCVQAQRQYLWQVLSKEMIVAKDSQAVRISSDGAPSGASEPATPERRSPAMNTSKAATNGTSEENHDPKAGENGSTTGINVLIAEAEALKELLRTALARANDLLTAVKRHKKQVQIVQSTLSALRGLQEIEA